jgi:cytoskeletal protein CcmA (bactofilin family)
MVRAMTLVTEQVSGPITIRDHCQIRGQVVGDVMVARDGSLELTGMITGNLTIEDGGSATVRGMVLGNALNAGTLEVYGIINGMLNQTSGSKTKIVSGARIHGIVEP